MPKQPSCPIAKKDDLDLIPPEEIRSRRIRRWIFLGTFAVCVLGIALYFTAPAIGGAIKAWQSRRLAREAVTLNKTLGDPTHAAKAASKRRNRST